MDDHFPSKFIIDGRYIITNLMRGSSEYYIIKKDNDILFIYKIGEIVKSYILMNDFGSFSIIEELYVDTSFNISELSGLNRETICLLIQYSLWSNPPYYGKIQIRDIIKYRFDTFDSSIFKNILLEHKFFPDLINKRIIPIVDICIKNTDDYEKYLTIPYFRNYKVDKELQIISIRSYFSFKIKLKPSDKKWISGGENNSIYYFKVSMVDGNNFKEIASRELTGIEDFRDTVNNCESLSSDIIEKSFSHFTKNNKSIRSLSDIDNSSNIGICMDNICNYFSKDLEIIKDGEINIESNKRKGHRIHHSDNISAPPNTLIIISLLYKHENTFCNESNYVYNKFFHFWLDVDFDDIKNPFNFESLFFKNINLKPLSLKNTCIKNILDKSLWCKCITHNQFPKEVKDQINNIILMKYFYQNFN